MGERKRKVPPATRTGGTKRQIARNLAQVHDGFFAGLSVQHVHGTAQSRVEGADGAPNIDGVVDVRDLHTDEGFFQRTTAALVVAGRAVPQSGGDDLVAVDLLVLHTDVVDQRTTGRFGAAVAFGALRDLEGG